MPRGSDSLISDKDHSRNYLELKVCRVKEEMASYGQVYSKLRRAQAHACCVGAPGCLGGKEEGRQLTIWGDKSPWRSWCPPASWGNATRTEEPNAKVSVQWLEVNCSHQSWVVTWTCSFKINEAVISFYSTSEKRLYKRTEAPQKQKKQIKTLLAFWMRSGKAGRNRYLTRNKKFHWRSQWTQEKSAD